MSRFKKIRKYILPAGIIFVLLLVLSRFVLPKHSDSELQLSAANRSDLVINVNAVGNLDADRSHVISSTIKGDKGKIIFLVEEGRMVAKKDILIKFDTAYFEAENLRLFGEVKSREAVVEGRKQILEWEKSQAEGTANGAEYDYKDAKREYTRYMSYIKDIEDLGKKGYQYPTEIGQAKKKAEQLYAKQQKFETLLEQAKKESVFKIAAAIAALEKAKHELDTARLALKDAQDELGKCVVYAPFQGIVVHYETFKDNMKRKPRVGDTVVQNQPLVYLPDISSMIVKTQVREIDLHKITVGQRANIKVDSFPELMFTGQVATIGVLASDSSEGGKGEKYFQITAAINGTNPQLRPGMTARVFISTDVVKNCLTIPIQAIFKEAGHTYCYVYKDKALIKTVVSIGKQNEDFSEILAGLKEGDRVSLIKPSFVDSQ